MNYSQKNTDSFDEIRWINEALKRDAVFIAVCMNEETYHSSQGYFPHFFTKEDNVLLKLIDLVNMEDERISLRYIINVEKEVLSALGSGEVGIDYRQAKRLFVDNKIIQESILD